MNKPSIALLAAVAMLSTNARKFDAAPQGHSRQPWWHGEHGASTKRMKKKARNMKGKSR